MKLNQDVQIGVIVLVSTLIVGLSLASVITTPRPEEQFFALATLGSNMKVEAYYPNNSTQLKTGDVMNWHIMVYNHMASVQYVSVRFKLLNTVEAAPNDTSHLPSAINPFSEVRRVLGRNETWQFPFTWQIGETVLQGDGLTIRSLLVNGTKVDVESSAPQGHNFRIVAELWVYDPDTRSFQFDWSSGQELRSAWNQVWFNATETG